MKKIVMCLLSLFMVMSFMVNVSAYTGTGTKDDPYIISTAEDLKQLEYSANYKYVYAVLEENITLTESSGNYSINQFYGELDGNGKSIQTSGGGFINAFSGGELKNIKWVNNYAGAYLTESYAGSPSSADHRYTDITVTGTWNLSSSNNNESPIVVYAHGNTTMTNVTIEMTMNSPTYNGLFIGYEPYKGSTYVFKNCVVKGIYRGQHIGVLFGNGSNNNEYGLDHIVGIGATSSIDKENFSIDLSDATIIGTDSQPHLLCGVGYAEKYRELENELKSKTTGYEKMSQGEALTGVNLYINNDGKVRVNIDGSSSNIAKIEVVSELYSNMFYENSGVYDGTLKLSVSEAFDYQSDVTDYYSSLGKVKFYDGDNGTMTTTGIDASLMLIEVDGETYYRVPFGSDGKVYTFGDKDSGGVKTNKARTSSARVVFYDASGGILDIQNVFTEETFETPAYSIETEEDTYGDIILTSLGLSSPSIVKPSSSDSIFYLPHTIYVKSENSIYPVQVTKTGVNQVTDVVASKDYITLELGDYYNLLANITIEPTENVVGDTLKYSVVNKGIVEVNDDGIMSALAIGKTTVRIETENGTFTDVVVEAIEKKQTTTTNPSRPSTKPSSKPIDPCTERIGTGWLYDEAKGYCVYKGSGQMIPNTSVK